MHTEIAFTDAEVNILIVGICDQDLKAFSSIVNFKNQIN